MLIYAKNVDKLQETPNKLSQTQETTYHDAIRIKCPGQAKPWVDLVGGGQEQRVTAREEIIPFGSDRGTVQQHQ